MTETIDQAVQPVEQMTNAASMGEARPAGIPGTGTLQVARGGQGNVLDVVGTWRLNRELMAQDTSRLVSAYEAGEAVWCEGKLDDPVQRKGGPVKVEVKISSVSTYAYDTGKEKTVFNFKLDGTVQDLL